MNYFLTCCLLWKMGTRAKVDETASSDAPQERRRLDSPNVESSLMPASRVRRQLSPRLYYFSRKAAVCLHVFISIRADGMRPAW